MRRFVKGLWTVSRRNRKTGNIPTMYVGATRDETWRSCEGCSLRPDAGGGCYAWAGNVSRGAHEVRKAGQRGRPSTLSDALGRAPKRTRVVRFGAIGDPSRIERTALLSDVALARARGLKVIGYTHHWRNEPITGGLRKVFLASCETLAQAHEAIARGWFVSIAGPDAVPGFLTCPNYKRPDVTCNRCGLCDVETLKRTKAKGIVFPAHGVSRKRLPLAVV